VTPRPVGGDTREALREEAAEAVYYADHDAYVQPPWQGERTPGAVGCYLAADAVLALDAVRAALDAQETLRRYADAPTSQLLWDLVARNRELEATVQRVEELYQSERAAMVVPITISGGQLRRALDGDR
jgi:hypothetical protein